MGTTIRKLSIIDSAFLFTETPETPMHVGSLAIVKLPENYTGDFFEDMLAVFRERVHNAKALTYKLATTPLGIDRPSWVEDDDFDIVRHVLRAALPEPGDRATLQRLVSWMHSHPLNRARPLWEVFVFPNLPGGQAAIYTKMHHALIDGGAGAALFEILYDRSPTPAPKPKVAPTGPIPEQRADPRDIATSLVQAYAELWRAPLKRGADLKAFELPRLGGNDLPSVLVDAWIHGIEWPLRVRAHLPEIVDSLTAVVTNAIKPGALDAIGSLTAPSTPINTTVSSERSFAAVSVSLERVKAVASKAGAKVNDVVLAMTSGMLRRYLLEIDSLPRRSLTSFVPVSSRAAGNNDTRNQVFGMVVPLATDVADPKERLARVVSFANQAKELINPFKPLVPHMAEMPTFGTPMLFELASTFVSRSNIASIVPPGVNLVVSNVFFSKQPFYIAGAELLNVYPMSVVIQGQALNVTVHGYRENLDFGLVAGANVLPHVEHLGAMLAEELDFLE